MSTVQSNILSSENFAACFVMTCCTGKCKKYKALKPSEVGRYASGQKRCNYCEIFVGYDE